MAAVRCMCVDGDACREEVRVALSSETKVSICGGRHLAAHGGDAVDQIRQYEEPASSLTQARVEVHMLALLHPKLHQGAVAAPQDMYP
jgi:hypothetical protein